MKITVKNIKKSFGDFQALKDISIVFESGQFITLLGASGCGKTTLLRIIAGLEIPDEGEVYFDNRCVFSKEKGINIPPEQRGLGFVFQDFALWPHMTVFENVAFGLRTKKDTKRLQERVMSALAAVQLEGFEKRYPHELSGGQQQRVAFARAIVIEPECILFDEPLSALDAILREEMRVLLRGLVTERNITSIFVTHDQMEAMSISDQIAVLNKGEILQKDTPEGIYYEPRHPDIAKFIGSSNWIDDRHMVRPEHLTLTPVSTSYEEAVVMIKGVQFLGNNYEVSLEYQGKAWKMFSPTRLKLNEKIAIYINKEQIIEF